MIADENQLTIAVARMQELECDVGQAFSVTPPEGVDPAMWDAHVAAMQSQLHTLERQIAEYRIRPA